MNPGSIAKRDHALDALRTLAVLGMMAAHTARLMPKTVRPDWADFVLLIEPIIPSLFLLLVGLSLAHSFAAAQTRGTSPGTWYVKQLKRAGALWLVSAVFFSLEMGIRLPDMFLAGGILANIAYAIVLVGGLLTLGGIFGGAVGRGVMVGCGLFIGIAIYVWLDATGQRVHPVNIGNSPFLPLWLFALAGAAWATLFTNTAHGRGLKTAALVLSVFGGAAAIWLILKFGLDPLFTKPFGRSDAGRLIPAPIYGGDPLHISYYNLRPALAAACLGLHVAALALFGKALATLGNKPAALLFAFGRRALMVYVLHLALLAALVTVMGERQPLKTGLLGTVTLLGLIVICQCAALLRRSNKNVQFGH